MSTLSAGSLSCAWTDTGAPGSACLQDAGLPRCSRKRNGRTLTKDDIAHYQKIVVALSETIRLMAEIDKVIEKHGGWPGAFQTSKAA